MTTPTAHDITALLGRWRGGDADAESTLMSVLYPVMRAMAQRELGSVAGGKLTVRATELANEAYLRLLDQRTDWESRSHFLAITGRLIRRVIIDLIRNRQAEKRGAGVEIVPLGMESEHEHPATPDTMDLVALDQAIDTLGKRHAVAAQVVELRYFSGLTNDETAQVLGIGVATVVRHWQFGRAFLHRRL